MSVFSCNQTITNEYNLSYYCQPTAHNTSSLLTGITIILSVLSVVTSYKLLGVALSLLYILTFDPCVYQALNIRNFVTLPIILTIIMYYYVITLYVGRVRNRSIIAMPVVANCFIWFAVLLTFSRDESLGIPLQALYFLWYLTFIGKYLCFVFLYVSHQNLEISENYNKSFIAVLLLDIAVILTPLTFDILRMFDGEFLQYYIIANVVIIINVKWFDLFTPTME